MVADIDVASDLVVFGFRDSSIVQKEDVFLDWLIQAFSSKE